VCTFELNCLHHYIVVSSQFNLFLYLFSLPSLGDNAGLAITGVYYAGIRTGGHQLAVQIVGICFAIGWSFAGTYIILQIIDICIGLRVSSIDEELGLDSSIHGEQVGTQMKLKSDYVNGNDDVNIGVVGGISTVV
jgi:ammonia channel protein AmtB